MLQRLRVAIPALFFFGVIVPTSAYAQRVTYSLDPASTFQRGCFPPCLCPIFATNKIRGTFTLEFIESDGTFDHYAVGDVQLIVLKADEVIPITGSGAYRIGGEPVLQQLSLDLTVGDEEHRFDSGLVPATAAFPTINIAISIHGMRCFDTAISIVASPVVEGNSWVTVAPLPAPMMLHGAVTGSDGRIYAFGGTSNEGPPVTATVFAYDVGADVWTTVAPLGEGARRNFAYARDLDGRVYAFGGYNFGSPPFPLARAERYDPAADAWTSLPEMPTPRQGAAAATGSDGRIYVMGGTDASFQTVAIVEVFDPGTDTWTTVAPTNTQRTGFGATASGGGIYAFGGYSGTTNVDSTEVYDPASGLWTTIASMNEIRFSLAAATGLDGRLYAIGGGMEGRSVEAYDPDADVWMYVASMSTPRYASAATLGPDGRIYAIGGDAIGSVEAYTPGIVPPNLRGGVLATFDVVGERFKVWIANKTAIDQVLAIQQGRTTATIPVARILRGSGQASHNAPYHWHMDPDNIEFAVAAIEVCDGTPSFVESHIEYFVDVLKTYCPWSAKLVALQDYR